MPLDSDFVESVSDLIAYQKRLSKENAILRQAAVVLFHRKSMKANVRMERNLRAEISVEFYESGRRANASR